MNPSDIAIAYSTCDRPELTKQTFPRLLDAGCDVLWLDGSKEDAGKQLFVDNVHNVYGDRITGDFLYGGSYRAIIYGLTKLLESPKNYQYIGLAENDNLLEPGWLPRIMEFFDLPVVGAVTARTLLPHVLFQLTDRALMYHCGGGSVIFRRECAELALRTWRSISVREVRHNFLSLSGVDVMHALDEMNAWAGADYTWDTVLSKYGWVTMAPIPTMDRNIDGFDMPLAEKQEKEEWEGAEMYVEGVRRLRPPPNFTTSLNENERHAWLIQPNHIPKQAYSNGWALHPFTPRGFQGLMYVSTIPNGSISVDYCGMDCAFFIAGEREVNRFNFVVDGVLQKFEFPNVQMQRAVTHLPYGYHQASLICPDPGMLFLGVAFSEHQIWFDYPEKPFDFHTLPPLVTEVPGGQSI